MRKRILVTTLIVTLLGMLVYSVVSASIFHPTPTTATPPYLPRISTA